MILKVLMCPCYKKEFQSDGNMYIKKLIHCHCKYKEKHLIYVLFCKDHPFGVTYEASIDEKVSCKCKNGLSHEVCSFCLTVRYLLNFKCFKIFIENVPDIFLDKVVSINQCFKNIKCEPFFHHRKIEVIWLK